jgi:hypothetical protein
MPFLVEALWNNTCKLTYLWFVMTNCDILGLTFFDSALFIPYNHKSVYDLFQALSGNVLLSPSQWRLLHELLVPFKLLAIRAAQLVPHRAGDSSLRRLPKDAWCVGCWCRMVRGMLV